MDFGSASYTLVVPAPAIFSGIHRYAEVGRPIADTGIGLSKLSSQSFNACYSPSTITVMVFETQGDDCFLARSFVIALPAYLRPCLLSVLPTFAVHSLSSDLSSLGHFLDFSCSFKLSGNYETPDYCEDQVSHVIFSRCSRIVKVQDMNHE